MLNLRSDQWTVKDRSRARWRRAWNYLRDNGPAELWRLARAAGPREISAFVLRNLRYLVAAQLNRRFDRRYRVETAGDIPADFLDVIGENRAHGAAFLSTPIRTLRAAFAELPGDLGDFTFIDIGAGKGRTLLLAATMGFRRIIGVEYAPELVRCARRNFASYRNPRQRCRNLACICADATSFELPPENCVLYFLRPFEDVVMAKVLANVKRSYQVAPRKILLMYVTPLEPEYAPPVELVLRTGFMRLTRRRILPFDWSAVRRFELVLFESEAA
jgi:hypothetical protein